MVTLYIQKVVSKRRSQFEKGCVPKCSVLTKRELQLVETRKGEIGRRSQKWTHVMLPQQSECDPSLVYPQRYSFRVGMVVLFD